LFVFSPTNVVNNKDLGKTFVSQQEEETECSFLVNLFATVLHLGLLFTFAAATIHV